MSPFLARQPSPPYMALITSTHRAPGRRLGLRRRLSRRLHMLPPPPRRPTPYFAPEERGVFPLLSLPVEVLAMITSYLKHPQCILALAGSCSTLDRLSPVLDSNIRKRVREKAERAVLKGINQRKKKTVDEVIQKRIAMVRLCLVRGTVRAVDVLVRYVKATRGGGLPDCLIEILVKAVEEGPGHAAVKVQAVGSAVKWRAAQVLRVADKVGMEEKEEDG